MSLQIQERLYVVTRSGEREIQLCVGDITQLPLEDKVDVLLISAFPGNYSRTRTSVMGALYNKLHLDVEQLSRHKKWDLRSTFCCWLSNRLPEKVPYKYLLCFEKHLKQNLSKVDAVKEMFRAFMPIFNTETKTVITPLLATGGQSANRSEILEVMVKSAFTWMQMGLPLQVFKIVIYAVDPNKPGNREAECIKVFSSLAKKLRSRNVIPKDPPISNDIFLMTAKSDDKTKAFLIKTLTKIKKDCRVVTPEAISGNHDNWQHNIHTAMQGSARVVPVLSSAFMHDENCIDLYNMALCCNRQLNRDVLAPICIERLRDLPAYMGMVQWFDCRSGEPERVSSACSHILEQIETSSTGQNQSYDVFISYSHKNIQEAKQYLEALQLKQPKARIFFDYDELKTGMAWQPTLYQSIENSRCVLALLSMNYLDSAVCQEELSLAMAKTKTQENVRVFLICLEKLQERSFIHDLDPLLAYEKQEESVSMVTDSVVTWLQESHDEEKTKRITRNLDKDFALTRQELFQKHYTYKNGSMNIQDLNSSKTGGDVTETFTMYVSYTTRDSKYVVMLDKILHKVAPHVKLHMDKINNTGSVDVQNANAILLVLSPAYFQTKSQLEEFHLILSRQRQLSEKLIVYCVLVRGLSAKPLYSHLVPVDTCLSDALWTELVDSVSDDAFGTDAESVRREVEEEHSAFLDEEVVALMKCGFDLLQLSADRKIPRQQPFKGVLLNPLWTTSISSMVSHSMGHTTGSAESAKVSSNQPVNDTAKGKENVAGSSESKAGDAEKGGISVEPKGDNIVQNGTTSQGRVDDQTTELRTSPDVAPPGVDGKDEQEGQVEMRSRSGEGQSTLPAQEEVVTQVQNQKKNKSSSCSLL